MASPGDSDGAPQAELQPSSSGSRDITMADRLENARSLTIKVLQDITDNFSAEQIIGQGAYGMVYLGTLENGEEIAVKKLYNSMPGIDDQQFKQEFENLMMLKHPNIVRLVGYCYETQHLPMLYMGRTIFAEKTHRALCFEYMQNGSLQKHLSDECEGLDWYTRYKIIKGTSEGLKYLHEGFKEPIYHLDLKPGNILLDKNMVPKLADFGLSKLFSDEQTRITQSPIGTIGYLPMEYLHGNLVSNKLDIFSLGVVMTKIIAGPRGNSRCVEMPHPEFLEQVHENWRNRLQAACHASQPLEAYCEQVNICLEIALRCMEIDRHKRPNIADIIHQLNDTEAAIDEALSWSASSHLRMQEDLVKIKAFTKSKVIPHAEVYNKFPILVRVKSPHWRHAEEMPRAAVDLVVVVDVLFCFKLRTLIKTIVNKLSPNDRLSIVKFQNDGEPRIMKLTFMSDQGRNVARDMANKLGRYCGSTLFAALQEGAEILRGREVEERNMRVGCILLVSDSNLGQEISCEFPVHTISSERQRSPTSLKYIADMNSGTYSFIEGNSDIAESCELFIAKITKIVVMSAKITLKAHDGITISSIESGGYINRVSSDERCGEIDINNICAGERKNFVVYLIVAEGNKKLVTIGGEYHCINSIKQLANMDVFVMRPRSTCPPEKLAIQSEVAAELVRIQLWKGLSAVIKNTAYKASWQTRDGIISLWDRVRSSEEGHGTPKKILSDLHREVAQIKKSSSEYYNPMEAPYTVSWLSCHEWQRATSKGAYYDSGAFTLAHPGASVKHAGSDGEDEDDGNWRNQLYL